MATTKIRYVGPHDEVEIAATGDVVKQNNQVEVDSDLAKSLLQQSVWEKADAKKSGGAS